MNFPLGEFSMLTWWCCWRGSPPNRWFLNTIKQLQMLQLCTAVLQNTDCAALFVKSNSCTKLIKLAQIMNKIKLFYSFLLFSLVFHYTDCYTEVRSVIHQAELEDNNQIPTAPPLIISSSSSPSAHKPHLLALLQFTFNPAFSFNLCTCLKIVYVFWICNRLCGLWKYTLLLLFYNCKIYYSYIHLMQCYSYSLPSIFLPSLFAFSSHHLPCPSCSPSVCAFRLWRRDLFSDQGMLA